MASSSGMQRADEVMAKLGKARVKKSATNWSWEDEEMMYESNTRDSKRTKRRLEHSLETAEQRKSKKSEKLMNIYMREERKLFLGGLAEETTEKDLQRIWRKTMSFTDGNHKSHLLWKTFTNVLSFHFNLQFKGS